MIVTSIVLWCTNSETYPESTTIVTKTPLTKSELNSKVRDLSKSHGITKIYQEPSDLYGIDDENVKSEYSEKEVEDGDNFEVLTIITDTTK